jgi:AcrR family transcriptional regulator
MATPDTAPEGLRARKNRRTRLAIVRATSELTIEESYAAATIARIAERADVAPRTVSTWFASKDEILFEGADDTIARGIEFLETGEGDVVDRLLAWFAYEGARRNPDVEMDRLRSDAIHHDPELRARYRQLFDRLGNAIAAAVATTTGVGPGHLGPQLFAGSALAFLENLAALSADEAAASRDVTGATPDVSLTRSQLEASEPIETGLAFLRAGLAAITPTPTPQS